MNRCNEDCFNCPYDDCIGQRRDSAYYREYYKTHKEAIMKARRKYYQKNKKKIVKYRREWYQQNKERINAKRREKRNASKSQKSIDDNGLSPSNA